MYSSTQSREDVRKNLKQQYGIDLALKAHQEKGFSVQLDQKAAIIEYDQSKPVQFFRAASYLKQWLSQGKTCEEKTEKPVFEHLTYMVDCSRNAVCRVAWLKSFIPKLAAMGYDRLMLYTEDTYEIKQQPFFGYMRGRYSKAEIQEVDTYASAYGIALVPCIQTLAHLNCIFRWSDFHKVRDTDDILCCDLEETYQLIEQMVAACAESFQSRVINIGMDEAHMIGRGRFLDLFGYEERISIMERHLKRVREICKAYGFTCMMWSDMFFRMLTGGDYYDELKTIPPELRARIPDDIELVYWDYYARDPAVYERMISCHRQMTDQVGFAGGAWKWTGFAPLLNHSLEASILALDACRSHKINHVMVTSWGDDGGEAAQAITLPVLALYAEYTYGQSVDESWLYSRLRACSEADLYDFLQADSLNLTPDNPKPGKVSTAPAKYLLYQDVLSGYFDPHIDAAAYEKHYQQCHKTIAQIASKQGPYQYIFATLASLADLLADKATLGLRLKYAYDENDRTRLEDGAGQCRQLAEKVSIFHTCLRRQWLFENKAFGLEVQDIRLGGLKERLIRAAERIESFINGEISVIEELAVDRQPLTGAPELGPLSETRWQRIVTAGIL